jgi:hypothetical protein
MRASDMRENMQMQPPSAAGRSAPSQPGFGPGVPSQPLGGPLSQPLGGSISRPLGGPLSQPLGRPLSQPLGRPYSRPAGGVPSQRRLRLSEAVDQRMQASATRVRQRSWLFNTIILAQSLITLALIPAHLIPNANIPMLIALAATVVVYIAAFIVNRLPGKFSLALGLLIGGGELMVAVQVFLNATSAHSGAHTAQTALFFLPVIIEAGLFISPELTLYAAAAAAVLTASGVLLAISLAGSSAAELTGAYQVVVYALGLDALVGYMSWQLATFINEKVTDAQTAETLRFAQARLEALQQQMTEQKRQLQREAGMIQTAISAMLSHEYDVRVEIPDGELAPLADSLNLLFERLRSTNELERKVQRMEAGVPPLVDIAERLAGGAPAYTQPADFMPDTALYSVSVALTNAQAAQARRLTQLLQLASDVVDALRDNRQVLERAAVDSVSAQRQAGELVSLTDTLSRVAQHDVETIAQARRLLARLLPRTLTEVPATGERDPLYDSPSSTPLNTGALNGLGEDIGLLHSGLTVEFDALAPADAQAAGIAPMTRHMDALDETSPDEDEAPAAFAAGELPGELVNAWELLRELHIAAAQEQRQVSSLTLDMGVLSRLVRQTDANVIWAIQALDVAQKRAEQAQALAGGASGDPLNPSASDSMGRQGPPSGVRRAALPTRPLNLDTVLTDTGRLLLPGVPISQTPAPGSIRVQDLVTGTGAQLGNEPDVAPPAPGDADAR